MKLAQQIRAQAGFTLIEVLTVLGILGVLFVQLMVMIGSSMEIWQSGEERIDLESRAHHATVLLTEELGRVAGLQSQMWNTGRRDIFASMRGREDKVSSYGRLVADLRPYDPEGKPIPLDTTDSKPEGFDWYPRLRFVAQLDPLEMDRRDRQILRERILQDQGELEASELERRVRAMLIEEETPAMGEVLLRVKPTGEGNGAYLALYRDMRPLVEAKKGRWVDGAELPELGEPLLQDLLYVGVRWRSQFTRSFSERAGSERGPELCWDSARAGLFGNQHPILRFSLDLDANSAADPLDDVMPRAYELTVVVDAPSDLAATVILESPLGVEDVDVRVGNPDLLPLPFTEGERLFVKIGSEWISYTDVRSSSEGGQLLGVKRGQRGTTARAHVDGARIHIGRSVVIRVPIAVARGYWNG
jgi:prepilin-type N-terminal cleavage/methylation domain-containing protein